MLHAKTAAIDTVWSTVGSTNMDLWSFARDDEVNAVILGQDFAEAMEAMFAADLKASDEVRREEWGKRSLGNRVKEMLARLLSYWL
jgi:cardiolipin synthase